MTKTELSLTPEEIARAKVIWDTYQRENDLSDRRGHVAGIDPVTKDVWIGEWFDDVARQRNAAGNDHQLFLVRIGSPTGLRKGSHH